MSEFQTFPGDPKYISKEVFDRFGRDFNEPDKYKKVDNWQDIIPVGDHKISLIVEKVSMSQLNHYTSVPFPDIIQEAIDKYNNESDISKSNSNSNISKQPVSFPIEPIRLRRHFSLAGENRLFEQSTGV